MRAPAPGSPRLSWNRLRHRGWLGHSNPRRVHLPLAGLSRARCPPWGVVASRYPVATSFCTSGVCEGRLAGRSSSFGEKVDGAVQAGNTSPPDIRAVEPRRLLRPRRHRRRLPRRLDAQLTAPPSTADHQSTTGTTGTSQ